MTSGFLCQIIRFYRGVRSAFGSWMKDFLSLKSPVVIKLCLLAIPISTQLAFPWDVIALMPRTNKLVTDKAGIVNAFYYPNEVFLALLCTRNSNSFQALSTFVVGHYLLGINCGFGVASTFRNLLSPTAFVLVRFFFFM